MGRPSGCATACAGISSGKKQEIMMSAPDTLMKTELLMQDPQPTPAGEKSLPKAEVQDLSFYYGDFRALKGISMLVHERQVTALIGPSGCGKTTFPRRFNPMHDLYPGNRYEGRIVLHPDNTDLLARAVDPIEVRMRIGMVFQKPNPFPKSIFENVAYGLRVRGETSRRRIEDKVEAALHDAALWDEVKNRIHEPAYNLS